MNQNTIAVGAIGIVIGLLISPAVFPGTTYRGMMSGGGMMWGVSQNIDRHFIEEMIPHHEGAIAMAKLALERSKRAEVRSLAEGIITAQEKENRDMRAWYEEWFGAAPDLSSGTGMMGMMHSGSSMRMGGMEGDIDILRTVSASEFDREFLEQMIPHHEMAIMMARMLQAGTERSEMKTLADNIITSQAREITTMRGWLADWY